MTSVLFEPLGQMPLCMRGSYILSIDDLINPYLFQKGQHRLLISLNAVGLTNMELQDGSLEGL